MQHARRSLSGVFGVYNESPSECRRDYVKEVWAMSKRNAIRLFCPDKFMLSSMSTGVMCIAWGGASVIWRGF